MPPPAAQPLPPELDAALRKELDDGEALLWTGQPVPFLYARHSRGQVAMGFLALMFAAMMLAALLQTWHEFSRSRGADGAAFFALFGVALLAGAVYLLLAPRRARRRAARMAYAITPRRAIVLTLSKSGAVEERDYRADELLHLLRRDRPDGSGDVIFEGARRPRPQQAGAGPYGFLGVRDAIGVERLLRRTFSSV